MVQLYWTADARCVGGVCERGFAVERAGQLELFDSLGSRDKRLHAYPGQHADNGPESCEVAAGFLKRYLEGVAA